MMNTTFMETYVPELEEVSDSSDDEDSYMEDIYDATDDLLDFLDEAK
jgi:hypothetical protein